MEPRYHHKFLGWNARLDAIQAAMLRVKLPHLDHWSESRQAAARRYDVLIEENGLEPYLLRPVIRPHRRHVFNQYVVRVAQGQRDALVRHLRAEKIGCEIYYPIPLHLQTCFAYLGCGPGSFPVSEQLAKDTLALPVHPDLTSEDIERVVDAVGEFYR